MTESLTTPTPPVRPLWLLRAGGISVAVIVALCLILVGLSQLSSDGLSLGRLVATVAGAVLLGVAVVLVVKQRRDRTRRWGRTQTALAVLILPGVIFPALAGLATGIRFPDPGAIVGGLYGLSAGSLAFATVGRARLKAIRRGERRSLFTVSDGLVIVISMLLASGVTGWRELPRRYGTVAGCVDFGKGSSGLRQVISTDCSAPHDGEIIRVRPGPCPPEMIQSFSIVSRRGHCIRPTRPRQS